VSDNVPNPLEPAISPQPAGPAAIPVSPAPVRSKGGASNRALNLLLGGALVLAIAGVAFAAGRMTAPALQPITGGNFPGGGVFNGQGNGNGKGGFGTNGQGGAIFGTGGPTIEGTVESVSDTTLTLKTADGQTIQIALDGDTTYHAQSDATASDVVTGAKVQVRLDFRRGGGSGPQATAGTGGGPSGGDLSAHDVTVVP
jgi:hypothetical protein